jgi:Tat protein translocase TatC
VNDLTDGKDSDRRKPASEDDQLVRMTLGEHLDELRGRLIKCLVIFGICFVAALFFQDKLMKVMTQPHVWAMSHLEEKGRLVQLTYPEAFMAHVKLAFIAAVFVGSPLLGYQIWAFVAAGLYKRERRWVYFFAPVTILLFIVGSLFGYFILVRYGLYFLAQYGDPALIGHQMQLSRYLDLVLTLTIVTGVIFELPVVMMFLSKIGLVEPKSWSTLRRYMIVGIFIVAAFLTPPDPVSQCLMAIPLLALYEIGVLVSRWIAPKPKPA